MTKGSEFLVGEAKPQPGSTAPNSVCGWQRDACPSWSWLSRWDTWVLFHKVSVGHWTSPRFLSNQKWRRGNGRGSGLNNKQVIYREKPNTCHLNLKGYLHKLKLKVSNVISPMDSKLFLSEVL